MGDGQAGKSKNTSKERDDSVKPKRTVEQSELEGKQKEAPLQKQFLDSLGKSWATLTGQGVKPESRGEAKSAVQEAKSPWQELQQWVSNPVHKWDESLMKASGNSPQQVAGKLKPEVVVSIDNGLKIQAALDKGRSQDSLSAQEKLDLSNYVQFKNTVKNIPLVDRSDVRHALEEAVQQRAKQLKEEQVRLGSSPTASERSNSLQQASSALTVGEQSATGKFESKGGGGGKETLHARQQVASEFENGQRQNRQPAGDQSGQIRMQGLAYPGRGESERNRAREPVSGEPAPTRTAETVRSEPPQFRTAAHAEASNPIKDLQEWVSNPVHKWDETLMKASGNSPEQVAQKLSPEAVKSIDAGRQTQQALDSGRSEQSLSAAERQDLHNYQQFKETLKNVPMVEQNDMRKSLEDAIQKRADQLKQNQAAAERTVSDPQNKQSGAEQVKKEAPTAPAGGQAKEPVSSKEATAIKPEAGSRPSENGREPGERRSSNLEGQHTAARLSDRRQQDSAPLSQQLRDAGGPQRYLDREMNQLTERQKSAGAESGSVPDTRLKVAPEQGKPSVEKTVAVKSTESRMSDSRSLDNKLPTERAADRLAERKSQNEAQITGRTSEQKLSPERNATLKAADQKAPDDRFSVKRQEPNPSSTFARESGCELKPLLAGAGQQPPLDRTVTGRAANPLEANSAKAELRKVADGSGAIGDKGLSGAAKSSLRTEGVQPDSKPKPLLSQLNVSELARALRSMPEPGRSVPRADQERNSGPTQLRSSFDVARNVQRLESLARLNQLQSTAGRPLDVVRTLREPLPGRTAQVIADGAMRAVIGRTLAGHEAGRAAAGQTRSGDGTVRGGFAGGSRVIPSGRFDPSGGLTGREPRGFTSAQRIDRRYIFGTEVALAAVIAAAGVARRRPPDSAAAGRVQDKPLVSSGDRSPDRRPLALPTGSLSVREAGIGRTLSDRQQGSLASNTRVDRRYIFGTEVAFAALIAAGGISRQRLDKELFGKQPAEKGGASRPNPTADGRIKMQEGARVVDRQTANNAECKSFTTSAKVSEQRHITGAEIALAAIISAAGVSKLNAETEEPAAGWKFPDKPNQNERSAPTSRQIEAGRQSSEGKPQAKGSLEAPRAREYRCENEGETEERPPGHERLMETLSQNILQSDKDHSINRKAVLHRPTTIISARDTLISIAEAFFHDPNLAWLIADLNLQNIKESWIDGKRVVELRSRQQIELPVWEDIEQFYRSRSSDAKPENLVTIIEETQIDRELLSNALGTAMGVNPASLSPFVQPASDPVRAAGQGPVRQYRWLFKRFLTNSQ